MSQRFTTAAPEQASAFPHVWPYLRAALVAAAFVVAVRLGTHVVYWRLFLSGNLGIATAIVFAAALLRPTTTP